MGQPEDTGNVCYFPVVMLACPTRNSRNSKQLSQSTIKQSPRQSPRKEVSVSDIFGAHRAKLWNEQVLRSSRKLCLIFNSSAFRSENYRRAFKYLDRCTHSSNNDHINNSSIAKKEAFYSIKEDKDEQKEFETGPLSVLMQSVQQNTQVIILITSRICQ